MGSTLTFDDKLLAYVEKHTPKEPELYRKLRQQTTDLGSVKEMQISWIQGRFMQLLARLMGAKTYLEVGVFTGYSALALAEVLPADGKITALDNSREWTDIARRYWKRAGVEDKIDLRLGDALKTLDDLTGEGRGETYDLAFIDADKENMGRYFDSCLGLLRPGGLVIADNVLWSGEVANPKDKSQATRAIRAFNDTVMEDQRVFYSLVPVGDGLILAQKK